MQSLSASIIILVGAACLCCGAFIPSTTIRTLIVMTTGVIVILAGLLGWFGTTAPLRGSRSFHYNEEDEEEVEER